jgi:hypothetical protein
MYKGETEGRARAAALTLVSRGVERRVERVKRGFGHHRGGEQVGEVNTSPYRPHVPPSVMVPPLSAGTIAGAVNATVDWPRVVPKLGAGGIAVRLAPSRGHHPVRERPTTAPDSLLRQGPATVRPSPAGSHLPGRKGSHKVAETREGRGHVFQG